MKGVFLVEENFEEFMKENRLSDNSRSSYLNDLKIFKQYYLDSYGEELNQLIHTDVLMYVNFLKREGMKATTINRKLAALKQYNLFLIKQKIQTDIVILDKDYIKIQPSPVQKDLPTIQELNKLKHFAAKDTKNPERDYCFIALFTYGGLRESELVGLRLVDIKLNERFLNIFGKGNKFRQVIINNIMYDALSSYLEIRKSIKTENNYLFLGQKNVNTKKPLNRNFCNRLLNKYKELCKFAKLHPHLLRSFFCTNALHNAGYSIEQVAAQAGHSSLNTTKAYLATKKEDLISLANNL